MLNFTGDLFHLPSFIFYLFQLDIFNLCTGKGWKRAFINYQVNGLRREVVYRFGKKGSIVLDKTA